MTDTKNALSKVIGVVVWLALIALLAVAGYYLFRWTYGSLDNFLVVAWKWLKIFGMFLLALLALAAALLASLFLFCRHRAVRAFVSHHHKDETIALTVQDALIRRGIVARTLPVVPRTHDEVVNLVRMHLKKSDALIAIPPRVDQSFANAEILAASILKKPIILIFESADRQLPATALRGYPALRYEKLERTDFIPLAALLNYLFFHRSDVFRTFQRSCAEVGIGLWLLFILISILGSLAEVLTYFDLDLFIHALDWIYKAAFAGAAALLLAGVAMAIRKQVRARRVARQQSITGLFSYDSLASALGSGDGDMEVLACLEPEPRQGQGLDKASG